MTTTTDTGTAEAGPPPPSGPPRFSRPPYTPIKGVCAGLARATGTDPTLWRVLFVVTVFFGGIGLAAYVAAIVLMPADGQRQSLAERIVRGPDRRLSAGQVLLLVLAVLLVSGLVLDTDSAVVLVVLGALGYLLLRSPGTVPPGGESAAPVGWPETPPAQGTSVHGAAWDWPESPPPPPAPPRSPFTQPILGAAVLVSGLLVLLGTERDIPTEVVLAGALAVVGLGLVVGSWWGGAPWLVTVAIALSLALGVTPFVRYAAEGGVGERAWDASTASSQGYRLGLGEATLDLGALAGRDTDPITVRARVDVGHLVVLVPDDLRVEVEAQAGLGELVIDGKEVGEMHSSAGGLLEAVRVERSLGPAGPPDVRLRLSAGIGQIEVRRG